MAAGSAMNAGTRHALCQCAACTMRRERKAQQAEQSHERMKGIVADLAANKCKYCGGGGHIRFPDGMSGICCPDCRGTGKAQPSKE